MYAATAAAIKSVDPLIQVCAGGASCIKRGYPLGRSGNVEIRTDIADRAVRAAAGEISLFPAGLGR